MGIRKGQGYGVAKPKRARCPEVDCGKKGVTQWEALPTGVLARHCQYCGQSWTQAAWAIERTSRASLPA